MPRELRLLTFILVVGPLAWLAWLLWMLVLRLEQADAQVSDVLGWADWTEGRVERLIVMVSNLQEEKAVPA